MLHRAKAEGEIRAEVVIWSGNAVLARFPLQSPEIPRQFKGDLTTTPAEPAMTTTIPTPLPFAEYRRELARLCGKDANARKQSTRLKNLFIERGWELTAVESTDVSRMMRDMHEAGKSPKTIETLVGQLSSFYEWAKREGLAQVNPCEGVKRTKRKGNGPSRRRGVRALTDEEVARLIAAAEKDETSAKPRTLKIRSLLYKVLRYTGTRVGQVTCGALLWRDVDLEGGTITFDSDESKNGRGNALPLHPEAQRALAEWRQRCEAADANSPVWSWKLQDRIFDGDLKAAGIPKRGACGRPAGVSSLRRSFAYGLVRSGVDVNVARRLMQHRTLEMTLLVYDEARNEDLSAGLKKMFTPAIPSENRGLANPCENFSGFSSLTMRKNSDSVCQPGLPPSTSNLPNDSPRSLEQHPQAWPFGCAGERWETFGLDPEGLAAFLKPSDGRTNRPSPCPPPPAAMPRGGLEPPLAPASGGDVRILVAELLETAARLVRATGDGHARAQPDNERSE